MNAPQMNAQALVDALPVLDARLYLIAHAPRVPGSWFTPSPMPPKPLPRWIDKEGHEYSSWQAADRAVGEDEYVNANSHAMVAWDLEREKRIATEWPIAWANAVLEVLARGGGG